MPKDPRPKRAHSSKTIETRSSKRQCSNETFTGVEDDAEITSTVELNKTMIETLNIALKKKDPKSLPIQLTPKPAESADSSTKSETNKPEKTAAEQQVDKKVTFANLLDPAYVIDDSQQLEALIASGAIKHLDVFSVEEFQLLGTCKLIGPSGAVDLTVYEQLLLKVAGEYYIELPEICSHNLVISLLYELAFELKGDSRAGSETTRTEPFYFITKHHLTLLISVVCALTFDRELVLGDGSLNPDRLDQSHDVIDVAIKLNPILSGILKMLDCLAQGKQGLIEPVHPLLIDNPTLAVYLDGVANGSLCYKSLSAVVKPIERLRDFDAVVTLSDTEMVPKVGNKQTPLTIKQYGRKEKAGPSTTKAVNFPDSELLAVNRPLREQTNRDTSTFKSLVMMEEGMKDCFGAFDSKLDLILKKLDVVEERMTKLEREVTELNGALATAVSVGSRGDLLSRQALNATLLTPQSVELNNQMKEKAPEAPIPHLAAKTMLERVKHFPLPGDSAEKLAVELKALLLENNQEIVASSVNVQTFTNAGAKARMVYSLSRLPLK